MHLFTFLKGKMKILTPRKKDTSREKTVSHLQVEKPLFLELFLAI